MTFNKDTTYVDTMPMCQEKPDGERRRRHNLWLPDVEIWQPTWDLAGVESLKPAGAPAFLAWPEKPLHLGLPEA